MLARSGTRDPASFTAPPTKAAIHAHSALSSHKRNSGRDPFVERLVETSAFLREHSASNFNAGILQDFDSAAAMSRVWVRRSYDDRLYAGLDDSVGACAGPANRRTGFQGNVQNSISWNPSLEAL